jgi:hypothetical protein
MRASIVEIADILADNPVEVPLAEQAEEEIIRLKEIAGPNL